MNGETLFEAIGAVEEVFLQELEQRETKGLPKRIVVLAAALALALTACAAPVILQNFKALKNGHIALSEEDLVFEEVWTDRDGHLMKFDSDRYYMSGSVCIEVSVWEDAPEKLENYRIPEALLDYCTAEHLEKDDTSLSLELSMNIPRYGKIHGIRYRQQVLAQDGTMEIEGILPSGLWEQERKIYGDWTVLEYTGSYDYETEEETVQASSEHRDITTKCMFWSDGQYLYCMRIPVAYPLVITEVEKIVGSMTEIEDPESILNQ